MPITLNAVIAGVEDNAPKTLCVEQPDGVASLPYGPFVPEAHRTFEIGVRDWVERQTRLNLGFIEQLYTFGDAGRESPAAALGGDRALHERVVSIGYLAVVPELARVDAPGACWRDWRAMFPWEDWRSGPPRILTEEILPQLTKWADRAQAQSARRLRRTRILTAFGDGDAMPDDARALDRYELLYEAGLAQEALRDRASREGRLAKFKPEGPGRHMASDHRRILATAIGRLRAKLRYRPILFDMAPETFTLLQLQELAETIAGFALHKQNFRRGVERSGLVEPTGRQSRGAGRPAALFRANEEALRARGDRGIPLPRARL